jgi:hypothetical protein
MSESLIDTLPEEITVSREKLSKGQKGRPTTIAARRKSVPVKGKVRGKRNHFTEKEKLNAVCVYAVTGNARRTAEITKIPEGTIRSWKTTEWWSEAISRVRIEEDEEISSSLTQIVNKAVAAVNDRIENGDYIYDTKRGEIRRKPMGAKDLAIVTAISIDKRQLLRGQPTSRVEKISTDEHLSKLAEEFRRFHNSTLIEAETPDAIEEREVEESNIPEYQDRDEEWETAEASDSNSDVESWQELEEENEEEILTINERFSE